MNPSFGYRGNVDEFCLGSGLRELLWKLDSLTEVASIHQALEIISICTRSTHSKLVQSHIATTGAIGKVLKLLEEKSESCIKSSALVVLYSLCSNNKHNQIELHQYRGVRVLVELLSIQYYEFLPSVLLTLKVCLEDNDLSQREFHDVCGFQMLFDLAANMVQSWSRLTTMNEANLTGLVDVMAVCSSLSDNLEIFWSESSYPKVVLWFCLIGSPGSTSKVLLAYLRNDSDTKAKLVQYRDIAMVVSLLSSNNFCLAKSAYSTLCEWLLISANHRKLLQSTAAIALLVNNISYYANPLAQLSSARIMADCIFSYVEFQEHIYSTAGHLLKIMASLLADDASRQPAVSLISNLAATLSGVIKQEIKPELEQCTFVSSEMEMDLNEDSPIESSFSYLVCKPEPTLDAPPTPNMSSVSKCGTCGGLHGTQQLAEGSRSCTCQSVFPNSVPLSSSDEYNNSLVSPKLERVANRRRIKKYADDSPDDPQGSSPPIQIDDPNTAKSPTTSVESLNCAAQDNRRVRDTQESTPRRKGNSKGRAKRTKQASTPIPISPPDPFTTSESPINTAGLQSIALIEDVLKTFDPATDPAVVSCANFIKFHVAKMRELLMGPTLSNKSSKPPKPKPSKPCAPGKSKRGPGRPASKHKVTDLDTPTDDDSGDSDFQASKGIGFNSAKKKRKSPPRERKQQGRAKRKRAKATEEQPANPQQHQLPINTASKAWKDNLAEQYKKFVIAANSQPPSTPTSATASISASASVSVSTSTPKTMDRMELAKKYDEARKKGILSWDVDDVCLWLAHVGLIHHETRFRHLGIHGIELVGFSSESIIESYLYIKTKADKQIFSGEVAKLLQTVDTPKSDTEPEADTAGNNDSVYEEVLNFGFVSSGGWEV